MKLFNFLKNRENRDSTSGYIQSLFSSKPKYSSQEVNSRTIVGLPAVNACIRLLKETCGVLPLITYQSDSDNNRERAKSHELYSLLKLKPNNYQTPSDFKELLINHLMIVSNAYIWVVKNKTGKIKELIPLSPSRVKYSFDSKTRKIDYFYDNPSAQVGKKEVYLSSDEIIHIKINSRDGIIGTPLMTELRDAFAQALETEAYAARTMAGDATPSGVITYPTKIGEEKAKEIKKRWKESHGSASGEKEVAVLEGGMTFTPIQFSPQDAQFIENRKLDVENMARIFRAPPHMIGHLVNVTVGNSDVLDRQYVNYVLNPLLNKIEEAINMYIFTASGKEEVYVEFKIESLLRGDPKSKAERDEIYIRSAVYSPNEIRKQLNENKREGGDVYAVPTSPQQSANTQADVAPTKDVKKPEAKSVILYSLDEKYKKLVTMVSKEQRLDKIKEFYQRNFEDYCQMLQDSGYSEARLRSDKFYDNIISKMPTDERREKYISDYADNFPKFILLGEINEDQKARE